MARLKKNSIYLTWFLAMSVALGPLATDMYLPAFPMLGDVFEAEPTQVQWTLSIFVIGIAGFQLVIGPISDRFGRKNILLIGLFIFVLASAFAAQASSMTELIIARLLQSIGVCAAIVIPRAIIRDLFDRDMSARKLSHMGTIMGLAPVIAPILGGYLTVHYGWPAIFIFLFGYGLLAILLTSILLSESHLIRDERATHPRRVLANYRSLFSSAEYLQYACTGAFCFAGFFAYISASSYVLITLMHVPVSQFGYYFAFVVLGYISGTLLGPKILKRKGLDWALKAGTTLSLIGGVSVLGFAIEGLMHPIAICLPMFVYNIGVGITVPQSQAASLHPFPEKAGAASALNGFLMLGFSAVIGLLVAKFYSGSAVPMGSAVFLMGLVSYVVCRLKISSVKQVKEVRG